MLKFRLIFFVTFVIFVVENTFYEVIKKTSEKGTDHFVNGAEQFVIIR